MRGECKRCGFEFPKAGFTSIEPWECPVCGALSNPPRPKGGVECIQAYFKDVWQIITEPTLFFRHLSTHGGLTRPLSFALITHWLGTAFSFLWHLVLGGVFSHFFQKMIQMSNPVSDIDSSGRTTQLIEIRDRIIQWFFGAGPIIADPFITLFSILFTSFFVFMGARICVSPGKEGHPPEISFESAVRIICFGLSPTLLAAIPFFGGIIAPLAVIIVTVIGAQEVYRISLGRAIIVALFPKVFFIGILMTGLLLFIVAVFKLVTSVI